MPPIADFVCNSPKCRRKDGSAPVYELPTKATHCPLGHKRIVRLFNQVRVNTGRPPDHFNGKATSSSKNVRWEDMITDPINRAEQKRDVLKAASRRAAGPPGTRWDGDMGIVHAVPTGRMAAEIGNIYAGHPVGAPSVATGGELTSKAERSARPLGGMLGAVSGAPIPTVVAARDDNPKG